MVLFLQPLFTLIFSSIIFCKLCIFLKLVCRFCEACYQANPSARQIWVSATSKIAKNFTGAVPFRPLYRCWLTTVSCTRSSTINYPWKLENDHYIDREVFSL